MRRIRCGCPQRLDQERASPRLDLVTGVSTGALLATHAFLGTLAFNNMIGVGRGGTGTLEVDGETVATHEPKRTLPMILQWDESFDIGCDTLTGVNDADYEPPFPLTAKLEKLTIVVDLPQLGEEDIETLENTEAIAVDGSSIHHVQRGPRQPARSGSPSAPGMAHVHFDPSTWKEHLVRE